MSDNTPLTLHEHREMSRELLRIQARVTELASLVTGIYGRLNPAALAIGKLAFTLDRVCREMRDQARQDCPSQPTDDLYR